MEVGLYNSVRKESRCVLIRLLAVGSSNRGSSTDISKRLFSFLQHRDQLCESTTDPRDWFLEC